MEVHNMVVHLKSPSHRNVLLMEMAFKKKKETSKLQALK